MKKIKGYLVLATLGLFASISGCASTNAIDNASTGAINSVLSNTAVDATEIPVVLIAGTGSSVKTVDTLTRYLQAQGRQVYPVALVGRGFSRTDKSVDKITKFIDQVKKETRASKVDLVGWSQGAHIARRYLQKQGVENVSTLVMLGSPTYEWRWMSYMHNLTLGTCVGLGNCIDQDHNSKVLHEMNDGEDMPHGVKVFNIWSDYDRIVTPSGEVSKLKDGNTGKQFSVQSVCEGRRVGHFGLVNDAVVLRIVEEALQGRQAVKSKDCETRVYRH